MYNVITLFITVAGMLVAFWLGYKAGSGKNLIEKEVYPEDIFDLQAEEETLQPIDQLMDEDDDREVT